MTILSIASDLTSFGAAGIMGAMWLWERRSSVQRERELSESHARIMRDEERLGKLTEVVAQNTAAITQFYDLQKDACQALQKIIEELKHDKTR